MVRAALLLAMILFSGSITPKRAMIPLPDTQSSADLIHRS
jgi:hypothetical protein